MSKKTFLTVIFLAIAGLVAGILVNQQVSKEQTTVKKIDADPLAYTLKDLEDVPRQSSEWAGKVRMVNFWASWCPPCVREIPAFIKLQEKYGGDEFTLIGIALDEKQAVVDFIDPIGPNYPILIAELEGIAITKAYGNRLGVLPYTALLDKDGKLVKSYTRELSFEEAEQIIKPYLSAK